MTIDQFVKNRLDSLAEEHQMELKEEFIGPRFSDALTNRLDQDCPFCGAACVVLVGCDHSSECPLVNEVRQRWDRSASRIAHFRDRALLVIFEAFLAMENGEIERPAGSAV